MMRGVLAALLLAGCATAQESPLASCGAGALGGMVGQPLATLPDGGWGTLRVIYPGDPVTEDYSVTRLNLYVDGNGIVQSISCG
jgi:hypothetical protein